MGFLKAAYSSSLPTTTHPVMRDPKTGVYRDAVTGDVVNVEDAHAAALASQAPAGYHYDFSNGSPSLVANDAPWYRDPALLGALALPAVPAILGAAGMSGGVAAAAGGETPTAFAGLPGATGIPSATAGSTGSGMGLLDGIKTGLDWYDRASSALQNLGEDASALASGRAQGRVQQAGINNNYDAMRLRAAQMLNDALTKQTSFNMEAPSIEGRNSAYGDALAGVQDAGVQGPIVRTHGQIPQITGGLRPSLLSANTRQLGQNISRQALMRNMNGADTLDLAKNVPAITPMPSANGLDTALNATGLAGGLAGGVSDFVNGIRNRANGQPTYPQFFPNPFEDPNTNQEDDWQQQGVG